MIIEVIGIGERNKGALLMLEAIKRVLLSRLPDCRIAVPITISTETRLSMGLWGSIPHDWRRMDPEPVTRWIPKKIRHLAGIVRQEEVDVLLDASGFGYGDYWGVRKLRRRLLDPLRRWKKGSRKAILMPQALGPFTTPEVKGAFRSALGYLDMVIARDRVSFKHVTDIAPDFSKVSLAPDFTNLLHAELPERLSGLVGSSIVIPNEKNCSGSSGLSRSEYVGFLAFAVQRLRRRNPRTLMLIHEGKKDRSLAEEVNGSLEVPVQILDEASPVVTKAIIGSADVVVSSRFHGLVSALSASVPVLACGWSHKYLELLADYECPQNVVDLGRPAGWSDEFDRFLCEADDLKFKSGLRIAALRERTRSEAMWDAVIDVIRSARA